MGLPLAGVLFLCFGLALAYLLARHKRLSRPHLPLTMRSAGVLALVLVILEGYLVLTSSRNEGTGFALPWLPALVILGVVAAASIPARAIRVALASILVLVSLAAVLSKSGWVQPLAEARAVSVPGLGRVEVTDGRGIIQTEIVGGGYDIGRATEPPPAMHRRWLPLARDVVGWSMARAERRGEELNLTLGFEHLIFSNSRLILAAQLWYHEFLPVDYLRSFPDGDTVASYRRQLNSPTPQNVLITGDPPGDTAISRRKVESAALSFGFVPVRSFTMPDGSKIQVWWRERGQTS